METGLDWVANDKVGLAPTSMKFKESDWAIVQSYDKSTGEVKLDRNLTFYHYGAAESTAPKYGGKIDLRGEVFLFTRNIRIVGTDVEDWGC